MQGRVSSNWILGEVKNVITYDLCASGIYRGKYYMHVRYHNNSSAYDKDNKNYRQQQQYK